MMMMIIITRYHLRLVFASEQRPAAGIDGPDGDSGHKFVLLASLSTWLNLCSGWWLCKDFVLHVHHAA